MHLPGPIPDISGNYCHALLISGDRCIRCRWGDQFGDKLCIYEVEMIYHANSVSYRRKVALMPDLRKFWAQLNQTLDWAIIYIDIITFVEKITFAFVANLCYPTCHRRVTPYVFHLGFDKAQRMNSHIPLSEQLCLLNMILKGLQLPHLPLNDPDIHVCFCPLRYSL